MNNMIFPFIIAEMSGNHNQSLEKALRIIDAAAACGVNALKIQTYTADTMTIDCDKADFIINDKNSLWYGRKLYDLYREASTPWSWHKMIFDRCQMRGIVGFSTPFDETAVDYLERLECPIYKIASFEIADLPLIKRVAQTKKPVIISTGMATEKEIREAVDAARGNGCPEVILLKCTSTYPADPKDSNLLTIPDMAIKFKSRIGLSDHTLGIGASLAAIGLGASVIEKHFTLSRTERGVDNAFSMEPDEMNKLVKEATRAYEALGDIAYGPTENEKKSLIFRRSLYIVKDMNKGDVFSRENVRSIRPGHGLSPKYMENMLGKKAKYDIKKGTPAKLDLVEQ